MNKTKLKIEYSGELNMELDAELEESMKKLGWELEGSGFDLRTKIRDLGFYKHKKD